MDILYTIIYIFVDIIIHGMNIKRCETTNTLQVQNNTPRTHPPIMQPLALQNPFPPQGLVATQMMIPHISYLSFSVNTRDLYFPNIFMTLIDVNFQTQHNQ